MLAHWGNSGDLKNEKLDKQFCYETYLYYILHDTHTIWGFLLNITAATTSPASASASASAAASTNIAAAAAAAAALNK